MRPPFTLPEAGRPPEAGERRSNPERAVPSSADADSGKSMAELHEAMERAFAEALEASADEGCPLEAIESGDAFVLIDEETAPVEAPARGPAPLRAPQRSPTPPVAASPAVPPSPAPVPVRPAARVAAHTPPVAPAMASAPATAPPVPRAPAPNANAAPLARPAAAPARPTAPRREKVRRAKPARRPAVETTPKLRSLPWLLGLASAVAWIGTCVWGWDYYDLALELRPLHPKHEALRSSGVFGLSMAIGGTLLMLLNLTYLLRKNVALLHRFGSLRAWMAFHILTGLVGPAMIVLHTGFLPTSALGTVSLIGMLVVVSTGIIGRYIYSRVPRSLAGRELELDEIRMRLGRYHQRLSSFGIDARRIADFSAAPPNRSMLGAIIALVTGDRILRKKYLRTRNIVLNNERTRKHAKEVLPLLRKVVREGQWLARYHELRSLMGSWRFLHRWLAILMLLLAGFHIYVGLRFGDLWVMP